MREPRCLSLRGQAFTLTLALGMLTAATVATLALTTSRMERDSDQMWHALRSVQATEELEKALIYHEREQRLYEATSKPTHASEVQAATQGVRQALALAYQLADTSTESALLMSLGKELEGYLANPTPAPGTPEADSGKMLDKPLLLSRSLLEHNLTAAQAIRESNERWEQWASLVGLGVSLALVCGMALALWAVRRQVYWPLLAVRQALLRFRPGAAIPHVPTRGVQEIRDIAHAFHETASRLERQREVQLGFLAGVAHDLRTPLHALRAAVSSVRPERPLPPEGKLRERFALVSRQVDRLTRMADDLLDTTRIEAGQISLNRDEHDLLDLVQEAVELHRPLSEAHEFVTSWPEQALRVHCDSTRIAQVLNNLMSNAIKYSPAGGQVRVEAGETAEMAWVAVSDTGVGIAASERESIFEPFRRSATTRDTIPGVGLGLSVARRILEAHGGVIEVASEPACGSTFRIWLPLAHQAHPPGQPDVMVQ
jgi:signal transduction histidine kinase